MSAQQENVTTLESLTAQILTMDPSDKEAIMQVGAALEPIPDILGNGLEEVVSLLNLALSALQGLYQETISDTSAALNAVAEAVEASRARLAEETEAGDGSIKQASERFTPILDQVAQDDDTDPQTEEPEPQMQDDPVVEEAPGPQAVEPEPEPIASPQAEAVDNSAAILPPDADQELMGEFIIECVDHIAAAEGSLLNLESDPDDTEEINVVFRAFHTIKGTSGFLGLPHTQGLAHLAENLLDRARDGEIQITGRYADLSLESCDMLRTIITSLEDVQPGESFDIPEKYDDLIARLSDPDDASENAEGSGDEMRVGDILVGKGQASRQEVEEAFEKQGDRPIGQVLVENSNVAAADVAKALRTQKKIAGRTTGEATIRVGTGRLDNLINMVGELVIAQSMVSQDPDILRNESPRLLRNISHAGKIIRELQDLTMSLRMVPLKGTFQKMARLVRDLARKAGKAIEFVTEGEETEIDRNMVEVLNDPLVHMIRNAVDHGVESAEQRKESGKIPTGTVRLCAYHAAGNVVIELIDDGKGLDPKKIIAKGVERGIVEAGKELTDTEAFNLIFQPGFSTAEKVTEISGRGVGMDVVRKGIEALRGRIDVASKLGSGSTFALKLPLTMAITDAMLLRVGKEHYLLPTASIEHSFRPADGAVSSVAGRGEMVMLRGNLLPVFRMHELFGVTDANTNPHDALFVCIEGEGRRCALMVDELLGQQQVVIKSLGQSMGQIPGVSGGSILGDGCVGLILDAGGLLKLAAGRAAA